ncbi:MAG TPA: signal peptidase I [Chloroflexia bacterium]|nr:signal peptidase I [Chloroflexia bacterium]
MKPLITSGNAALDGYEDNRRGWFIGHFLDERRGLRSTADIEVKWGIHPQGEVKISYALNEIATTMSLLISGRFKLDFPDQDQAVTLAQPGDYVIFGPGVPHIWEALEDSVVLSVRWPSLQADQKSL